MSDKSEKKRFSVTLTNAYVEAMNKLIADGIYLDEQDTIRDLMRRGFQYHRIEPFFQSDSLEEEERREFWRTLIAKIREE